MPTNSNILKLKQKLKTWNWVPEGLTPRQQRLAWVLAGILLLLALYLVLVYPLLALNSSWSEDLTRKRRLLVRYQALQESKATVGKALLGKQPGDEVAVSVPAGTTRLLVESIDG